MNARERAAIKRAIAILDKYLRKSEIVVTSPEVTKQYLRLQLQPYEHEVFSCMFLDNRHQLITYQELFRGTLDGASVHPREVVKEALRYNAAAVVFAHNHPSGVAEPSQTDLHLTRRLREACELVGVRTLDHIIIGGAEAVSFAERGLL